MTSQRQKKAGFELPSPVDGWPLMDICLKIPDAPEYRRAFLGHLYKLGLWAAWEKSYLPGDTRAKDAAQLWRDVLNQYLEMGCDMGCCPEPLTRVNPDGTIDLSDDGGLTWHPAGNQDPRATAPQFPPLGGADGADKRCKAANNVVEQLKSVQIGNSNSIGTVTTVLEMAALAVGFAIAVFATAGLATFLIGLFFELAAALLTTTKPAYDAEFTTDVWNYVLCRLYCVLGPDGVFTQANFSDLSADFDSHFTGNVALTITSTMIAWQLPGLNNASRIPSTANLDCSECDCPDCSPTGWWSRLWIDGTPIVQTAIIETGPNYVIVESGDRGDGQQIVAFSAIDGVTCCNIDISFVDGTPASLIATWNLCPAPANYNTRTTVNPALGNSVTQYYLQMSPSAVPWKVKFTFV